MEIKTYIDTVIGPRVQADTGWLDYASLDENCLHLIARGTCADCPCLGRCLKWVEDMIAKDLGVQLRITAESKPYIWHS